MKARAKEILGNRWLSFAVRVVLGGIFITSSISKLQNLALFTDTVIDYGILPNSLAQFYGTILPWAELFIGCSLVLGIFSIFASAIAIPVIVSFIIAHVYALFRSVEDICGCFGELITLSHWQSMSVNAAMLLIAVQLLLYRNKAEFLGFGPWIARQHLGLERTRRFIFENTSKLIIVALAMSIVVISLGVPWSYNGG